MSLSSTLRLTFPQWQGGGFDNISQLVPELPYQEAIQGYYLGSQLLEWLAPKSNHITATVPVSLSLDKAEVATENGIQAYPILKKQLKAALDIIEVHQPAKVVTLGGECSVSIPAFSYLAKQYEDDVAVIWLDAHRDLTVPTDHYNGYHAMALTTLLGVGDKAIVDTLPATIKPENALIVGLRSEDEAVQRQKDLGVKSLSPEEVKQNSQAIISWLKQTGKRKVLIHFDLDVLDPAEFHIAVGKDPNGLTMAETIRIIQDIDQFADTELVGLTIAEPMPKAVITLRRLLHSLPLMK
ncbi:arginase family protein [Pelistega sp. NLN82]|uniref:Arginase family protein n=1 Tax=Pelistega ratti TaxID=2652177 RepID=A0A6L9Y7M4_9BURK|nr:arginase family protein [Pelistega ratti]NEN76522.1 arginase family protein [Pelistega ratti]